MKYSQKAHWSFLQFKILLLPNKRYLILTATVILFKRLDENVSLPCENILTLAESEYENCPFTNLTFISLIGGQISFCITQLQRENNSHCFHARQALCFVCTVAVLNHKVLFKPQHAWKTWPVLLMSWLGKIHWTKETLECICLVRLAQASQRKRNCGFICIISRRST